MRNSPVSGMTTRPDDRPVSGALPTVILIDDRDDPRIAPYRAIRERDLVGRDGHFIAEGEVVLKQLLSSDRHQTLSLLIAEKRVNRLATLLARLPASVPIYAADQKVLDDIAGFPLHRGILALGQSAPMLPATGLLAGLPPTALVVVLIGISNHDNVGGVFRNAAAFRADAVLLDTGCCDPLYRKAIRVSVGATLRVPFARLLPADDVLALLSSQGFDAIALSPAGTTPLAKLTRSARMAVLLGTEGPGLPAELLTRTRTVGISMAAGFDSLNVATTSGIVLHHLVIMC
jgi:tRNA G18 (ribose-2'-O)-methylase SpoU